MDLKDSVAVVTGASKGIGRAIALSLAQAGVNVVLASRSSELLSMTQKEIIESGGKAVSIPTDVTSDNSVRNLIIETQKRFNSIDILINNAGVGIFSNVIDMKTDEYEAMMNVNLKGVFLCSRAVLPAMMRQRWKQCLTNAS